MLEFLLLEAHEGPEPSESGDEFQPSSVGSTGMCGHRGPDTAPLVEKQFKISHQPRQSSALWSKGLGARAKPGSCCCCAGRKSWRRKVKAKRKSSEVVVGLARTKELSLLIWSHPSLVIVHRFWWDQLGWGRSSALSTQIWVTAPGSVFIP